MKVIGGAVLVLCLAACAGGGHPNVQSDSPAASLASEDDASTDVASYQSAYDQLAAKCTDKADVASDVDFAYDDLRKNGVTDETRLTLLQHLAASIPDGQEHQCRSVVAAYLVLREPK